MANKRNSLPPPSDDELAAAEERELSRLDDAIQTIEDRQGLARLARAGDPEAMAALAGTASVLEGRPVEDNRPPIRRSRKSQAFKPKAKSEAPAQSPKGPTEQGDAYALLDIAFRKWKKNSQSNIREANKQLARDIVGDLAIFMKHDILRLESGLDALSKLTRPVARGGEEEESEDYEGELEGLRMELRGGKTA